MSNWLTELSREILGAIVMAILGWIGHFVARLARDVNAFFGKVRDIDKRLKVLEGRDEEDQTTEEDA